MWLAISYSSGLLLVVGFKKHPSEEYMELMTMRVLYGIFPVFFGGLVIQYAYIW